MDYPYAVMSHMSPVLNTKASKSAKSLAGIVSFLCLLFFVIVNPNDTVAHTAYEFSNNCLAESSCIANCIAGVYKNNDQKKPAVALEDTYYDSDWNLKNYPHGIKGLKEFKNYSFTILHFKPANSFNYSTYYGFSPLRSPPAL